MSLLRFLKKPGGGYSSPLLSIPQSSAEKAAIDEVALYSDELRAKTGRYAGHG